MDTAVKENIDSIYQHVLTVTNKILRNCKYFHIEILQLEDPSYDEIAEQLTEASEILNTIANAFPGDSEGYHMAVKSREYTQCVIDIARAIRRGDEDELKRQVDMLDRRPFL